jgi:hypothetical protein
MAVKFVIFFDPALFYFCSIMAFWTAKEIFYTLGEVDAMIFLRAFITRPDGFSAMF